jgi:hypothetical protein
MSDRYYINNIPERLGYEYVLGVDLGFNDHSAFSVLCYHKNIKFCYIVKSYKETQWTLTRVAQEINSIRSKYPIGKMVIDGANKQGVEDIKQRFKLKLESAEKTEKAFFLRALDDDFKEGNVLIVEKDNPALIGEWKQLQWKDEEKKEEDDRCQNHLSDATLYAWRKCRHYKAEKEGEKINKNTDKWMDKEEQLEAERFERNKKETEGVY